MRADLQKQIDEFYKEMEKEESFDIGYMACSLVPRLVGEIKALEKQLRSGIFESYEANDYEE